MDAAENQIVVSQPNEIVRLVNTPKKREPRFEGGIRRRRTRRALKRPRASLKCLGSKCLAFTKLDAGEICRIKKSAFASGARARGLV